MKILLIFTIAGLCLGGCLTPASKINDVRLGMTKSEVIAVMGTPGSITADQTAEYLNYALAEGMRTGTAATQTPFEIKIVNGKVVSYGRAGAPRGGGGGPIIIPPPVIIH
ncbi:MAG: hypothetical protein H0W34_00925 [Pyrinomonadaceae bacterium]|nr:hypothetical protein [Pyrinomonadaceae bacterium]